jgi:MerR family transcriptional regulator, copper efflux regulator
VYYTIGALGAATGERPKTLRYWTEQGLLQADRTAANYRSYGPKAPGSVAFIRLAQAAGFTLRDIKALLELAGGDDKPCAEVRALAQARLSDVQAQLRQLRTLEASLTGLATVSDAACPDERCAFLPEA